MTFIPAITTPPEYTTGDWWFIFLQHELLVFLDDEQARIPTFSSLKRLDLAITREQYLGTLDNIPCYCAEVEQKPQTLPTNVEFCGLRSLFERLPPELFWTAGRAYQLMHWNRTHQFCGQCGHATQFADDERAKRCPECGHTSYPRISPAVIVAVVKDERELLLAHAKRFPKDLYSVIAGFVEPGETFEEAIRREVKEEVNIDVTDIRYFGSQPWPFPDSLMVAFTAKYAGGKIRVDNVEITHAGWYTADNLPLGPSSISVARKLINWFVATYSRDT
jgi:NAD+ diphosphatase